MCKRDLMGTGILELGLIAGTEPEIALKGSADTAALGVPAGEP